MSRSSWCVRPELKAAAGKAVPVELDPRPAEHVAVEGGRPLDVPHIEHEMTELLDLHVDLLPARPGSSLRATSPVTLQANLPGRHPAIPHHGLRRRSRTVRVGRPRAVQPLPADRQRLGQDPHAGHGGHEVGVPHPPGNGVQVEMARDAGARGPTEVGPEVDALRASRPSRAPPPPGGGPTRARSDSSCSRSAMVADVAKWQHHQMAARIGIGVEHGEHGRPAPDHPVVGGRVTAGHDATEHAMSGIVAGDGVVPSAAEFRREWVRVTYSLRQPAQR